MYKIKENFPHAIEYYFFNCGFYKFSYNKKVLSLLTIQNICKTEITTMTYRLCINNLHT